MTPRIVRLCVYGRRSAGMKRDMGGSAGILGAFRTIALSKNTEATVYAVLWCVAVVGVCVCVCVCVWRLRANHSP